MNAKGKKEKDDRFPFRIGTVKKPSQKRIDSVKNRALSSFNVLYCYVTMLPQPVSLCATLSFVKSVILHFFLPQYFQKIRLAHYPVKSVDHALDQKVPFKPEHIWCYLDFINIWIRPIAMLLHRFGIVGGAKLGAEFLKYIKLTYDEAWKLYSQSMTTTVRPFCTVRAIKNIRRADPHFMCVPSLHIAIVCLCFSFYRMLFEREDFSEEEKQKWNTELYKRALEIGETVLYVKQHSVNCIPAALYMLTRIVPELFCPKDACDFISSLFKGASDVPPADREEIISYMQFMYERFLLEGSSEENWTFPIIHWLTTYTPFVPPSAD